MNRRTFINTVGGSGAAMAVWPSAAFDPSRGGRAVRLERSTAPQPSGGSRPPVRFAAIGLNHSHVNSQVETVLEHGGELAAVFAREPDLVAAFTKRFPQAKVARSEQEILDDKAVQLVVSAAIPNERAALGIRVMQHGKDFMVDKPGVTTLAQLAEVRKVQASTKRIYSILYGGRLESPATTRAVELVRGGAIGEVVHTMGLGPHKIGTGRADWFWKREQFGGVIGDLGTHQADYFLAFTRATRVEVVAAQVANLHHPEKPDFEDFGDAMLRSDRGSGYFRVDWFTPGGVAAFGDSRLTVMGTDGYLEVRPQIDLAGRPGGSHLFLVDQKETRYIDSKDTPLPYGARLLDDIVQRTETAMSQAHAFLVAQIVLEAQAKATSPRLGKT
jgi:predicted dehydrogenase